MARATLHESERHSTALMSFRDQWTATRGLRHLAPFQQGRTCPTIELQSNLNRTLVFSFFLALALFPIG